MSDVVAALQVAHLHGSERDPERTAGPRTCTILAAPIDVPIPEHLTGALADAALQAWPGWWEADIGSSTEEVVRRGREALGPDGASWVDHVAHLAAGGHLPLVDDVPRAAQVGALGSALGELAVEVESPALDEPSADALSRGLEWLAAHLPAGEVRWRVPREAAALPGVRRLPGVESLDGSDGPSAVARPRRRASASKAQVARDADVASHAASARPRPEEPMRAAWPARFDPIIGRPHPASPAEQALFRALQRSHLAGTFRPNHPVSTRPGPRLVVDLFGAEPRLVVEIDGYAFHGGPSAFQRDRDRDFCLLASGLRVLRLTHDEIMRSVDEAVAKIRAVVDAGSTEAREREG